MVLLASLSSRVTTHSVFVLLIGYHNFKAAYSIVRCFGKERTMKMLTNGR